MSQVVDMGVRIGRLALKNPIMTASGTFGFGVEYEGLMDVGALGAIVTKGISLEPRLGNPAPRIAETPAGLLNAVGLQNPGLEGFVEDKLPWLRQAGPAVVVNILGDRVEDYASLARQLDALDGVDALEVNISCPNVAAGGIAFGSDPSAAAEISAAVVENTTRPVLVKLSPNVTDLVAIAKAVAAQRVDGLTLINTLRGMAIDPHTGEARLGNGIGGLSGPAIRPIAVRAIYEVHQEVELPIVGCGGLMTALDAVEFLRAGASAVQVGSATFRRPDAAIEVLSGLRAFCQEQQLDACSLLSGAVSVRGVKGDPRKEAQDA